MEDYEGHVEDLQKQLAAALKRADEMREEWEAMGQIAGEAMEAHTKIESERDSYKRGFESLQKLREADANMMALLRNHIAEVLPLLAGKGWEDADGNSMDSKIDALRELVEEGR